MASRSPNAKQGQETDKTTESGKAEKKASEKKSAELPEKGRDLKAQGKVIKAGDLPAKSASTSKKGADESKKQTQVPKRQLKPKPGSKASAEPVTVPPIKIKEEPADDDDVKKREVARKSPRKKKIIKVRIQPRRTKVVEAPKTKKVVTKALPKRNLRNRGAGKKSTASEKVKDSNPAALLDMLAEVASATLENDSTIQSQESSEASSKNKVRRILQSELLTLDQIRVLSDKILLTMFAELTDDEIRRNYTYTCYLQPEKCQQQYSSFGSEARARVQMKTHLLGHVAQLLAEATTAGKSSKAKFTAEPVFVRKRRLATAELEMAAKKKCVRKSPTSGKPADKANNKPIAQVKTYQTPKPPILAKKLAPSFASRTSPKFTKIQTSVGEAQDSDDAKTNVTLAKLSGGSSSQNSEAQTESEQIALTHLATFTSDGDGDADDDGGQNQTQHFRVTELDGMIVLTYGDDTEDGEGGNNAEEVNLAALPFEQHLHDHCYTTIEGRKRPSVYYYAGDNEENVVEIPYQEEVEDEQEDEDESAEQEIADQAQSEEATKKATTVQVRAKPTETAFKQLETLRLLQLQKQAKPGLEVRCGDGNLSKILEDDLANTMEIDYETAENGSADWEQKMALKCIRMLRTKKKDERVALVCQICKDKTFTAQATLMYHYRSHAGIKPFVCNICNTTFTRQHSLNYHMLIHNNKSRFTCEDCGRKFRHPSHFKEHMRRHTGETPFECGDCGVRFKTRNTYKRHLKTRHGKLLTANGIELLSPEEFLKVKTNPRKRPRTRRDKETQWPEVIGAIKFVTASTEATNENEDDDAVVAVIPKAEDVGVVEGEELEEEEEDVQQVKEEEDVEMVEGEEEEDDGVSAAEGATLLPLMMGSTFTVGGDTPTTFILTADGHLQSAVHAIAEEGLEDQCGSSTIKVFPSVTGDSGEGIPIVVQSSLGEAVNVIFEAATVNEEEDEGEFIGPDIEPSDAQSIAETVQVFSAGGAVTVQPIMHCI